MLTCLVFANVCFIEGCVNCLQSTTVGNYKKEHIKKAFSLLAKISSYSWSVFKFKTCTKDEFVEICVIAIIIILL